MTASPRWPTPSRLAEQVHQLRLGGPHVRRVTRSKVIWRLFACGVVASAVILGILAAPTPATRLRGHAAAQSAPLADCGPGVPAVKCNPALYTPGPASAQSQPPSAPTGTTLPPSAASISCGTTFFSPSTQATLVAKFGNIQCFQFSGTRQWVVVGDGMSLTSTATPPDPSSGGSIVAVATCAAGDSNCLDANAVHDFRTFTVFYPPLPRSGKLTLQTSFGSRLLYLSVARCGVFTFDLKTLRWYGYAPSDDAMLLSGGSPSQVATPAPVSGSAAQTGTPPVATSSCQAVS